MRKETIEGIGSCSGGDYEELVIEGIGKLKNNANINNLKINGMFKSKGKIISDIIEVNGTSKFLQDVKVQKIIIDGIVKLNTSSMNASRIVCDGIIVSKGEISADEVEIDGVCSIKSMYGDNIKIFAYKDNKSRTTNINGNGIVTKMIFGRKISSEYAIVDNLECTTLVAEKLYCKELRVNDVKLYKNCHIDNLYCDGNIFMDDSCEVKNIIKNNTDDDKNYNHKDYNVSNEVGTNIKNIKLSKILKLYKDNKISEGEAEKMITSITINKSIGNIGNKKSVSEFMDDNKIRVHVYLGNKKIKTVSKGLDNININYLGDVNNIECYGNLSCKNVQGKINSEGNIEAEIINGDVQTEGDVSCHKINGKISAEGGVTIS